MRSDVQPGASSDPHPGTSAGHRSGAAAGRRVGPLLRLLDALTGLFAAGMLVLGIGLLLAQWLAPVLLSAAGWGAATGPGWTRVLAHLLVGVTGEVVFRARHRLAGPFRVAADVGVIVAAVAVVALAWWP